MGRLGHYTPLHQALNILLIAGLLFAWRGAYGEGPPPAPRELVRQAIQNEVNAGSDASNFMFRDRKETPKGSQTKLMVQTRDATAGMLIAINDQPLSPDQRQAEQNHLQYLATHPEELRRKQKQEKDDADRVGRILRAMPTAFVYERVGTESGKTGVGTPGEQLVHLKFRPDPKYNPPSRVEQVLTGMQGDMLIDAGRKRIARIDGTLFRDVSFGWGILGHLDRGGRFQVEQGAVDGNSWEMTRISLDFTGKVLLFKTIVIKSTDVFSDFKRVPPELTFAQGISLLQKQSEAGGSQGGGG
jgi:hypothetical protein